MVYLWEFDAANNDIVDITVLEVLHQLGRVYLANNQITDTLPLANNPGLGQGDTIDLTGNPLSAESVNLIETLRGRGVNVIFGQ